MIYQGGPIGPPFLPTQSMIKVATQGSGITVGQYKILKEISFSRCQSDYSNNGDLGELLKQGLVTVSQSIMSVSQKGHELLDKSKNW
jgi:hypothetical protein